METAIKIFKKYKGQELRFFYITCLVRPILYYSTLATSKLLLQTTASSLIENPNASALRLHPSCRQALLIHQYPLQQSKGIFRIQKILNFNYYDMF